MFDLQSLNAAVSKRAAIRELQRIPGIGLRIAQDLWEVGIRSVEAFRDQDAEALYRRLCEHLNRELDRCILYVLRCAVYYASNECPDPRLLKWSAWRDEAVGT